MRKYDDENFSQWVGLKKAFSIAGNLSFACLLIFMVILLFSMVQSRLRGGPPQVAGHQIYIVLSGSMSPAFDAGSLAFVQPLDPRNIGVGDIITYRTVGEEDVLVTHRVVQIVEGDGLSFITRGDANDMNDRHPVPEANVVGKVNFALPYGGYIMGFGQSKAGVFSLIIIPGILITVIELRNLSRMVTGCKTAKNVQNKKENKMVDDF
ncbi:MAG: signal peptidase I [Dethiobacteria bacterium]|jgi:signal peptidase